MSGDSADFSIGEDRAIGGGNKSDPFASNDPFGQGGGGGGDSASASMQLQACPDCGRTFNPKSYVKHVKNCLKVNTKRKPYFVTSVFGETIKQQGGPWKHQSSELRDVMKMKNSSAWRDAMKNNSRMVTKYQEEALLHERQSLAATNKLNEQIETIRMKTLFEMVSNLKVTAEGKVSNIKNVWLNNKQAHMFTKSTMLQLLHLLEIKNPPPLVIFIRGGKLSAAHINNGGQDHLPRTKSIPLKDITCLSQKICCTNIIKHCKEHARKITLNESNAKEYIKPGDEVWIDIRKGCLFETKETAFGKPIAGYIAQILSFEGPNCTIRGLKKFNGDSSSGTYASAVHLGGCPLLKSMKLYSKLVSDSTENSQELERKISIFVHDILMPIIVRTGALVVSMGINNCSLCVALGDAFARHQQHLGMMQDNNSSDPNGSTAGVGNPRFIGIVKYPEIAASAQRTGSNVHALVTANHARSLNNTYKNSFVTKEYQQFLNNSNGKATELNDDMNNTLKAMKFWPQYDIVDGLTDVVLIDQKDADTGYKTDAAYNHFFNLLANIFNSEVPSLSIQFGHCPLEGLVDLTSGGSDLLVLDSRKRAIRDTKNCTLSKVLGGLIAMHRKMWSQGSLEFHTASTIAYLHDSLCEYHASKERNTNENNGTTTNVNNFCTLAAAIQSNTKTTSTGSDRSTETKRSDTEEEEMSFESFINQVVEIIRANAYVNKVLERLYFDDRSCPIFATLKYCQGKVALSGEKCRWLINDGDEMTDSYLNTIWDQQVECNGCSVNELRSQHPWAQRNIQEVQDKIKYEEGLKDPNLYPIGLQKIDVTSFTYEQWEQYHIDNNLLCHKTLDKQFAKFEKTCLSHITFNEWRETQDFRNNSKYRNEYVTTSPELLECLTAPMKELANKPENHILANGRTNRKLTGNGMYLHLFTLLKPAYDKGENIKSDLFSGSLHDLKNLSSTLEDRLTVIDRLPLFNTLEELHALRNAWDDVDRYELIGTSAKCAAKYSYILLLVLGIATVVVSSLVGAGQFDNAAASAAATALVTSDSNVTVLNTKDTTYGMQSDGDYIAFGLALFSSFCATYIAYFNPVQKWQQLKNASLMLRSEIIKFRTRTGDYDYKTKTLNALVLREAVGSLRESTLSKAGISGTSFFKEYSPKIFKHGQYGSISTDSITSSSGGGGSSRIGKKPSRSSSISPSFIASPEQHVKPIIDDYHSPMDANQYLALRLEPMIRRYQSRITPYYTSKTTVAIFLMLATGASALMASLGLTVWIAIISICASSVTSWSEFSGVQKKLNRYSSAITKLRDVRLWWETLSPVEQSSSKHVTQLLVMTEDVIMANVSAWLATSMAAKSLSKAAAAAKGDNEV